MNALETKARLGDSDLTLILDFNALCAIEEQSGLATDPFFQRLDAEGRLADVRLVVWAMTRSHHSDLTIEDVGSLIGADVSAALAVIGSAVAKAQPDPDPAGQSSKKKSKAARP